MTAERLARELGGRCAGSSWMARCPAHDDRIPSLSVQDGQSGCVLVRCHAGCSQERVIGALRARGLWSPRGRQQWNQTELRSSTATGEHRDDGARRAAAIRLWHEASPAKASPAERYLRSRGIELCPPDALRFHPALKHPAAGVLPAMVALVTTGTDARMVAIHRTFLRSDGSAKAGVEPQRMMLGPCRGGVARLAVAEGGFVMVGEGIETCLSAMQATGKPCWAALSTVGLRHLELPQRIGEVILLADGDPPGESAAVEAARRLKRQGRSVRIARPGSGVDFNDVLTGRCSSVRGLGS